MSILDSGVIPYCLLSDNLRPDGQRCQRAIRKLIFPTVDGRECTKKLKLQVESLIGKCDRGKKAGNLYLMFALITKDFI